MFDMVGLSERRKINVLQFLNKLVNEYTDCSKLLCFLNLYVPHCRTRSSTQFYAFTQKTNYVLASSINRIRVLGNNKKN